MDKVTRAVVDHYRARIEERQHDIGGIDASLLVDAVIDGLAQRLQLLIPRVYVVEFHRARHEWGYPVDASSSVAVDRYLEQFGAHTIVEWFERYPALRTLLDGVVDALGVDEFAANYWKEEQHSWQHPPTRSQQAGRSS